MPRGNGIRPSPHEPSVAGDGTPAFLRFGDGLEIFALDAGNGFVRGGECHESSVANHRASEIFAIISAIRTAACVFWMVLLRLVKRFG